MLMLVLNEPLSNCCLSQLWLAGHQAEEYNQANFNGMQTARSKWRNIHRNHTVNRKRKQVVNKKWWFNFFYTILGSQELKVFMSTLDINEWHIRINLFKLVIL